MNPEKILVIGGGGHAKVVINLLLESEQFVPEGILDNRLEKGSSVLGVLVQGGDQLISGYEPDKVFLALGVGMMRASPLRKDLYDSFREKGFFFPTLIHSKTCIGTRVVLEDGIQVMAGVTIQPETMVGPNSILNTGAIIEHNCLIGAHSHISPGAVIGGNVVIGEGSLVGLGAQVLPGVKIGRDVTIGAGAAVVCDIPDGQTVAGVPAKIIHDTSS